MAIYSFQCKIVARTKRLNNAVAHAAYINRIDLDNSRDGSKWRYSHSHEDVYKSAVLLPDNANEKFSDPAYLWNEVEKKENRSNSRLARSFIISLPNELTPEQNKNLIEDYIKNHMTNKGMIVNYAIHIDDTNNFHAHLMSTTRELDKSGLEFAKKNVIGRTWNDDEFLEGLRKGWADTANTHLARLDHQVRIDHRTLSAQRDEALEQFEMATTAEAKAEALAKAVSLDRPAIKRIWRSKLNTEEGRALREAQQDRRDLQLVVAEETKKSVLSLPQEIVLNNFAPKKIKSKSKTKTTIEKTRPAPEAVLKTADGAGRVFSIVVFVLDFDFIFLGAKLFKTISCGKDKTLFLVSSATTSCRSLLSCCASRKALPSSVFSLLRQILLIAGLSRLTALARASALASAVVAISNCSRASSR
ncbi:MobA/MobL family protein [Klebsiella michiganensis]